MSLITLFLLLLFLFSLVSGRLKQTIVTSPMVFTLVGLMVVLVRPQFSEPHGSREVFLKVAETGLVLLLFADASRTDLTLLKRIRNLPFRLLGPGMLLTMLLGALLGKGLVPGLSWWHAGILAAILAPTDAGLGQMIVSSPRVPLKIRQALNVEAGLNDGLSVPFLLFFIALAERSEGHEVHLSRFMLEQLGYGALIGIGIGLIGGWFLGWAQRKGWQEEAWRQLGVVALPLMCALVCPEFGASMFIASFVAGLAVQVGFKDAGKHSVEFTEDWGQLLNLSVFFLFGVLAGKAWSQIGLPHVLYGVLSLTIVRMLPVAISLVGTKLSAPTVIFMGWFGPRGLASIVLGLVYLEETQEGGHPAIQLTVIATVFLSIIAHGLTTVPGIDLYAARLEASPEAASDLDAEA